MNKILITLITIIISTASYSMSLESKFDLSNSESIKNALILDLKKYYFECKTSWESGQSITDNIMSRSIEMLKDSRTTVVEVKDDPSGPTIELLFKPGTDEETNLSFWITNDLKKIKSFNTLKYKITEKERNNGTVLEPEIEVYLDRSILFYGVCEQKTGLKESFSSYRDRQSRARL
jgi:hypothetical protein